jgi:hypothetical protein
MNHIYKFDHIVDVNDMAVENHIADVLDMVVKKSEDCVNE